MTLRDGDSARPVAAHPRRPEIGQPSLVLERRRLGDLRLHRTFESRHLAQVLSSSMRVNFEAAPPIDVTTDGIVLSGFPNYLLAMERGIVDVDCLVHELDETDALAWILERNSDHSRGLNDYCRIVLALDSDEELKERAKARQQAGRRFHHSTNLSKGGPIDCRREIARIARVSQGNVDKVRRILKQGSQQLHEALMLDEISIHRAWSWLQNPEQQDAKLDHFRTCSAIQRAVDRLHRQGIQRASREELQMTAKAVIEALNSLSLSKLGELRPTVIRSERKILAVSDSLLAEVEAQGELTL